VLARALARSVFAGLPPAVRADVLVDHRDARYAPGETLLRPRLPERYRTALVVSGLLRLYLESPDGRQAAARYCGPGYFLGAACAVPSRKPLRVPFDVQAVTPTRVLHLDRRRLHAAARSEIGVALALLQQLGEYQTDLAHLLAGATFGSIRQRTAVHLLNMSVTQPDETLVAPITQQTLADAVGTIRETVARAVGELRRAGAIETVPGGIRVRDPEYLAAAAHWLERV
jgi:CRP/FNR family transcriptional regulator, cyclic AMP receptor protein